MKLKKVIIYLLTVCSLIVFFTLTASCEDKSESEKELEKITQDIFDCLDDETKQLLSDFGIESLDYNAVFDFSFSNFWSVIKKEISNSSGDNKSFFFKTLAMLIILITINTIQPKDKNSGIVSDIFTMIVILYMTSSLSDIFTMLVTAFNLTSKFMLTYIPILTVIVSLSGNITSSAIYSSAAVGLAETLSALANDLLLPLMGVYFGVIISLSFNDGLDSEKINSSIQKAVSGIISFLSLIFTFILSVKNVLAKDVDTVLYKSGKYIIANAIPVVGSAVSSILNSIIGSVSLIKSTIAIFAIIAVVLINLPVLIRLTISYFSLYLLGLVGDLFGEKRASNIIRSFSQSVKIMAVLVIFELVLVIITTGLVISVRGEM